MTLEYGANTMRKIYLIHGLMGTARQHFGPQIQEWETADDVIPLDLPGHGTQPGEAPVPFFRSALEWVIEQVKDHGRGHLVGLSLGASVAIHLAILHPELCESITLTGYAPAIPAEMAPLMEQQYKAFSNIRETAPEVAAEFETLHGDKWYKTLKAVLDDMTFHYPTVSREQIQSLGVPTLVLNGSKELYEREAACEMARLNDRIEAGLIPGAGHTAGLQQPALYSLMVQTFWERVEGDVVG